MNHNTDYTFELGKLLEFTAKVATAIRMYTVYNSASKDRLDGSLDVMWLADALHHYGRIAQAVVNGQSQAIIDLCDELTSIYTKYRQPTTARGQRPSAPSFERNGQYFDLDEAIAVFAEIRAKAAGQKQAI